MATGTIPYISNVKMSLKNFPAETSTSQDITLTPPANSNYLFFYGGNNATTKAGGFISRTTSNLSTTIYEFATASGVTISTSGQNINLTVTGSMSILCIPMTLGLNPVF